MKRAKKSSKAQAVGRSGRTGCSTTEEAHGFALRVGGCRPYLATLFSAYRNEIEDAVREEYHRPMEAVIVPLREWRRLKRLDRKSNPKVTLDAHSSSVRSEETP